MNGYTQNKRPLQSIKYLLLSMLFLFTLTLAQPAFASTTHTLTVSVTPAPTSTPTAPTDKGFARARVSVVRLLVSYTDQTKSLGTCIGLGVLVKSWPTTNADELNSWVVTDGFLLDGTNGRVRCVSNNPKGALAGVQIFFNTSYSRQEQPIAANTAPLCVDQNKCFDGPALIGFHSDTPLPFVDLASKQATKGDHAIALTKDAEAPQTPTNDDQARLLTPQLLPFDAANLEPGTPFIDAAGHLSGLHPASSGLSFPVETIAALIKTQLPVPSPLPENTVNTNWNNGIEHFYQKNYPAAQADFQKVVNDSPDLSGSQRFQNLG